MSEKYFFLVRNIPKDIREGTRVAAYEKRCTLRAMWVEAMREWLKNNKIIKE